MFVQFVHFNFALCIAVKCDESVPLTTSPSCPEDYKLSRTGRKCAELTCCSNDKGLLSSFSLIGSKKKACLQYKENELVNSAISLSGELSKLYFVMKHNILLLSQQHAVKKESLNPKSICFGAYN